MTQERAVELKMSVVGDPLQLAKTVFTLLGVGKRLSQNYYVREVVHKISAGDYTMDLDSISDGVGGRNTDSRIAKGFELLEPMSAKMGKKGPDFSESTEGELAAGQSLAERDPVVAVQDAQGNLVLVADAKAAAQPTQTQATQLSTANDLSSPAEAEVTGSFSAQQAYRPPIMSKESEAARAFLLQQERPEGAPFSTQPSTPAQATSQGSTVAFVPPPPGLEPSSSDMDDFTGPPNSVFDQIELQPVEFVAAVPEEPLSSGP
jgi:hypothetical protein